MAHNVSKASQVEQEQNKIRISLLLPVYNEAETIEETILEYYNEIGTKIPLEIIVSEDGSTDGTKEVLRELNEKIPMKLILGKKRKGYMKGVKDGLRKVSSDFVFFVDSDGQHVASDFWKVYERRDKYDLIVGKKIKRSDSAHRIILSRVFHLIVRALFHLPIHDPDTAYRLIRKEVLQDILEEVEVLEYSFWTEFTVRAFRKGFRIAEVPVIHRRRSQGDTRLYQWNKLPKIVISQFVGLFKLTAQLEAGPSDTLIQNLPGYLCHEKGKFIKNYSSCFPFSRMRLHLT